MLLHYFWCEYHQYWIFPWRWEDGTIVPSAEEHVLLGITSDSYLTFYSHLKLLWIKVANKLSAHTRIAPYLSRNQRQLIYSSFFIRQLTYLLLTINTGHSTSSEPKPPRSPSQVFLKLFVSTPICKIWCSWKFQLLIPICSHFMSI